MITGGVLCRFLRQYCMISLWSSLTSFITLTPRRLVFFTSGVSVFPGDWPLSYCHHADFECGLCFLQR